LVGLELKSQGKRRLGLVGGAGRVMSHDLVDAVGRMAGDAADELSANARVVIQGACTRVIPIGAG